MSSKMFTLVAVIIILAIVLFYPLTLPVAPAWTILVVDQNNHPVAGCNVQESWTYSFIEHEFHHTLVATNADGLVVFPAQDIPASFFRRFAGRMSSKYAFHSAPARPIVFASACLHQPGLSSAGQIDYKAEPSPTRVQITR